MPEEVQSIPIHAIDPSPYQPRHRFDVERLGELAASIRELGLIQPLVLRRAGSRYQVIAGERRLRAARLAGMERVPAIIRPISDEQALEAALVENLQREDLTVVETARAYQRLATEFHYSQSEIGQRTGRSRAAVANTMRLLQLPDRVLELLDNGELTEGHARTLITLPYPSIQIEAAEWMVRNAVPVREAEERVRELMTGGGTSSSSTTPPATRRRADVHIDALESRLRDHFGTRAAVSYRKGRGALTLEFYSDDDLERLLEIMGLNT